MRLIDRLIMNSRIYNTLLESDNRIINEHRECEDEYKRIVESYRKENKDLKRQIDILQNSITHEDDTLHQFYMPIEFYHPVKFAVTSCSKVSFPDVPEEEIINDLKAALADLIIKDGNIQITKDESALKPDADYTCYCASIYVYQKVEGENNDHR